MNKTIGIVAHVDAGKTTFSEQLLYLTRSIKQRGRVDHQSSFLDHHEIERQRGITVFAEQAYFHYKDSHYFLIDTPGHVDFASEMERALAVMDAAIVIISAVEGLEAHTETVWQLLRKHNIPTFIFINKIDRVGADVDQVMMQLTHECSTEMLLLQSTDNNLDIELSEQQIEWLAERDEELFHTYMDAGYDRELWLNGLAKLVMDGKVYPCVAGSALQNDGIEFFLEALHQLTVTNYEGSELEPVSARVYKIRYDNSGARITFLKLLSGMLSVRHELSNGSHVEKITGLRRYHGNEFESLKVAYGGELIAVTGLIEPKTGDGLGQLYDKFNYEMIPMLRSKVVFHQEVNAKEAFGLFKLLEAEDPALNVQWEESHYEIQLQVMGSIQLEVLQQVVQDRFGLAVSFASPEILYKETIAAPIIGYGHFEPLRHYAEVHLKLEPAQRGSGVSFISECHVDELSAASQRLIGQHVLERGHHALLTGSPLTDIIVTLLTGREHNKHTHGGDFREATYRALRQALEKADNVLLEPYYSFKIIVHIEQLGRVISDVQRAYGQLEPLQNEGERAVVSGRAPVATFMNYATELASFTGGKGRIHLSFGGYAPCHNPDEVIERIGYNKDADPQYTSSSIFCAKGAGYSVKWDEAEVMMHIK